MNKTGLGIVAFLILAAGVLATCGAPAPSATLPPTPAYAPEPEANFALYFSYGCLGETLDIFQGTFTRGMCPPDPAVTIALTLSAQEMQTIYREMAKIDLFGYPDQFSVVVPEGAVVEMVTPSDFHYLKVRNGGAEKELYWNDNIVSPTTKEADQLRVFLRQIIDIIYEHPEIKLVPTPNCACA